MTADLRPDYELAYDVVDVFVDPDAEGFSGNQLAVVHGSVGLADAALLAITREFGYSETTFPAEPAESSYGVRIFTPGGEVPFAGHPTLGTAWVLRERGVVGAGPLVQRCAAGDVSVRFDGALVELTATPRPPGAPLPDDVVERLLAAVGLESSDRAGTARIAGAGLDFAVLPVVAGAVGRAHPSAEPIGDLLVEHRPASLGGLYLYAQSGRDVHARMFATGLDVAEDAATGSAAAALGVHLATSGGLPPDGRYDVRQGAEMGRPSWLAGRVDLAAGGPERVHVTGEVRPVAAGHLVVPPGLAGGSAG